MLDTEAFLLIELRQLLAFVPQPVKAVIVLFPITPKFEEKKKEEDEKLKSNSLLPVDPTIIWIKQTVQFS